jgi:GntR family transcriptional regulator/MocR family aminotransferase
MLARARYTGALVAAKRNADLGNSVLPQLVLARLIESGELERQLRFLRGRHRRRKDAMIEAIAACLPHATVHGAAAGLHLTITFDDCRADASLAAAAISRGGEGTAAVLALPAPAPARPGTGLRRAHPHRHRRRHRRPQLSALRELS